MTPTPDISQHAVSRYVERVDRGASRLEARLAISRLASLSRARPVPRHWMRRNGVQPQAGVLFLYPSERPDVCLVVREHTVLTVLTRAVCVVRRPTHLRAIPRRRDTSVAEDAARRWRWDGIVDREDAA